MRFNTMYEVTHVAGNRIEAALALKNISAIMGQAMSNQNHRRQSTSSGSEKSSSSSPRNRGNKLQYRHSTAAADRFKTPAAVHRQSESVYKVRDGVVSNKCSSPLPEITNGRSETSVRPITISEMNAYNAERNNDIAAPKKNVNSNQCIVVGANTNSNSGGSVKVSKKKEFYTVGEGYHKTDSCYIKTPDGGYHKLPPDSYHKMSEVCYNKMPDGSFRRLDNLTLPNNISIPSDGGLSQSQQHNKMRNHIIRFLKRSKSHTPATIKEMQKSKEKEREHRISAAATPKSHSNNAHASQNAGSRKVVVTMMENGGLPIVATSKSNSKRDHPTRESTREYQSRQKVIIMMSYACLKSRTHNIHLEIIFVRLINFPKHLRNHLTYI